jgi:hypothetical protein
MRTGVGASPNEPCHDREYSDVIPVFSENKPDKIMNKQSHTIKVTSPSGNDGRPAVVKIKNHPTEEQIRRRARVFYMARGGRGHPLIDWLQAERELMADVPGTERKRG